eukprot:14640283-Heterocapsa_arctica.AAC.1
MAPTSSAGRPTRGRRARQRHRSSSSTARPSTTTEAARQSSASAHRVPFTAVTSSRREGASVEHGTTTG